MTDQMTDNELIARFMGYEFINDAPNFPDGYWSNEEDGDWLTAKDMQYEESWDWIHNVMVEKAIALVMNNSGCFGSWSGQEKLREELEKLKI